MNKLEKLDNQMFQPLTDSESDAILGGAFTFIGLCEKDGKEYDDYRSGDCTCSEQETVSTI
ncbi:MAG TPA: hypothetical protein VF815_00655 [Myxococcaceae bacterium]|jgi:hypothetical protein